MNRSIQITALVRQKASIPHADFPDLLQAFLDTDDNSKRTQALEASGYALRTNTQMKWDKLETFIKDVCRWGDYAGVYGRVLNPKNNPRSKIELKVRSAISLLNSTPPDLIGFRKHDRNQTSWGLVCVKAFALPISRILPSLGFDPV